MWHSGNEVPRIARNEFTLACPKPLPRSVSCCSLLLVVFRTLTEATPPAWFWNAWATGGSTFSDWRVFWVVSASSCWSCTSWWRDGIEDGWGPGSPKGSSYPSEVDVGIAAGFSDFFCAYSFSSTRQRTRVMVRWWDIHAVFYLFIFNLIEKKITIKVMVQWWGAMLTIRLILFMFIGKQTYKILSTCDIVCTAELGAISAWRKSRKSTHFEYFGYMCMVSNCFWGGVSLGPRTSISYTEWVKRTHFDPTQNLI